MPMSESFRRICPHGDEMVCLAKHRFCRPTDPPRAAGPSVDVQKLIGSCRHGGNSRREPTD